MLCSCATVGLQRQDRIPGGPQLVLPAADRLDGFRDLLHQRCGQLIRSFLVAGEFPQLPFGLQIFEGRFQGSRSCRKVPHPSIEAFAGAYGGFLEFLDPGHLREAFQRFFGLVSDFDNAILLLGEGLLDLLQAIVGYDRGLGVPHEVPRGARAGGDVVRRNRCRPGDRTRRWCGRGIGSLCRNRVDHPKCQEE